MFNPNDKECICYGNWRAIVEEYEKFLDKKFINKKGIEYLLVGFVHSSDDYYYLLWDIEKKRFERWSCVGDLIKSFGLQLVKEDADDNG